MGGFRRGSSEKISKRANTKWLTIRQFLLSHAQYLANLAGWLDHHYKTKCEVSGGGGMHCAIFKFKMATIIYVDRPGIQNKNTDIIYLKGVVNCHNTRDNVVPRMQQWPLDIPQ